MDKRDISHLRQDYRSDELDLKTVDPNPFKQFDKWFDDALRADIREPNAMAIATVGSDGKPSCRIVLLKEFNSEGLVFFTNYHSHKGRQIEENPNVGVTFFWENLERQVRVEGRTEKIPARDSEEYFYSRPEGSQIGAIASPQSREIQDREELEKRVEDASKGEIKRPDHWGGYLIRPELFEFWQGRTSRLHDRIQYKLKDGQWLLSRLAP
jgi:pyridoxamine 5'-phosphate oxidase